MQNVVLDLQILIEKIRRINAVSANTSNFHSSQNNKIRLLFLKENKDSRLIQQI